MAATITKRTVLITGCSEGGLGAALCQAFQQSGFHVFATLRNPEKAMSLKADHIDVLPLEVTSSESVQKCVDFISYKTGGTLDVLVNNAGSMLMCPLLDVSIPDSRKVFDVNVWGVLAVTQAFAPLVIKANGAILNICSIAGAVRLAWQGIYNSSKAAETWISETLRIEMEPLGVRVVTAMVGEVETKIYQNAEPPALPKGSYYKCVKKYIADQAAGRLQKSNEPAEVTARNLVLDVLSGRSGQTWRGGVAGTAKLASWLLPTRVFVSSLDLEPIVDIVLSRGTD